MINGNYHYSFTEKFSYISGGSHDGISCNLYTKKSKSHKEFFYLGTEQGKLYHKHLEQVKLLEVSPLSTKILSW